VGKKDASGGAVHRDARSSKDKVAGGAADLGGAERVRGVLAEESVASSSEAATTPAPTSPSEMGPLAVAPGAPIPQLPAASPAAADAEAMADDAGSVRGEAEKTSAAAESSVQSPAARASSSTQAPEPSSPLSRGEVASRIAAQAGTLLPCLLQARKNGEVPGGRLNLAIALDVLPDGRVKDPKLVGPKPLLSTSLSRCVPIRMRAWTFRAASAGTAIRNFEVTIPAK
jgi:hypothetical protein